jgi:formylglycine-generating enzyme required for sulfatase activity
VHGGFAFTIGSVHVLRAGVYRVTASAEGYRPFEAPFTVGDERNQTFEFTLEKLPGKVTFASDPPGATVLVDGKEQGTTPIADVEVAAGEHNVAMQHPRYQPATTNVMVEGRGVPQSVSLTLTPNWAPVRIVTDPPGATVSVDDEPLGTTPGTIDVLAGTHRIHVKLAGHKAWEKELDVVALQPIDLPPIKLDPADGLVTIVTKPAKAGVTVDGRYRGETPLELRLQPGKRYQIRAFKAGFASASTGLAVESNREARVDLVLNPLIGKVIVNATPPDAELVLDGSPSGTANRTLELSALPHSIEIRKPGYAPYSTKITPQPGLVQEVKVKLLTTEEARVAALTPRSKAPDGSELVLIEPGRFTSGSSRREPGRRANETLREVTLTRLYYLGVTEVTNAQFRKFSAEHSSGDFQEQDLNEDRMPVARVTWEDAARYCNWLSQRANLPLYYRVSGGKIVGFDPTSKGYRLPSEAEWEWASRRGAVGGIGTRFPWGDDLPPPDRFANLADRAAAHLVGRVVFGYNDNHIAAAPVGTFKPDQLGLLDMAGNVAEWTNDYYEIPPATPATDPRGPASGEYHVIRGSSWMHGTVTDLRHAFRDYGTDGRPDLGFRIARSAE